MFDAKELGQSDRREVTLKTWLWRGTRDNIVPETRVYGRPNLNNITELIFIIMKTDYNLKKRAIRIWRVMYVIG